MTVEDTIGSPFLRVFCFFNARLFGVRDFFDLVGIFYILLRGIMRFRAKFRVKQYIEKRRNMLLLKWKII